MSAPKVIQQEVQVYSPFPETGWSDLWAWTQEFPDSHKDDYGPGTFEAFKSDMESRRNSELSFAVECEGKLCGAAFLLPLTKDLRLWQTHGIVFSKAVHGSGIPQASFKEVLRRWKLTPGDKLCAAFFGTNTHIRKFLGDLGFIHEGFLRDQTLQHGKPLDVCLMAYFRESK